MIKLSIDTKASLKSENSDLNKSNRALDDYLRLSNRSIKSKRRDFDVLELNLAHKGISELKSLVRFKNLNCLWLQSNKIRHLPFIQNCDSLSEVYLQNNLIQSIEFCFRNLTNISVLFLNMNQLADLKSVANELSYLKYLKILNLYENPIALETEYHNLIIYKCPSLEIFDKNLLEYNDKERINKLYEPDRIRLEKQRAFLRSFHHQDTESIFKDTSSIRLLNKRAGIAQSAAKSKSMTSLKIRDSLLSRKYSGDPNTAHFNRSIREFSYFDWSKVKLYENDSSSSFNNRETSLNNNSSNFSTNNTISMTTIATTNTKSNYSIETNSHNNRTSSELPQVITIRYT